VYICVSIGIGIYRYDQDNGTFIQQFQQYSITIKMAKSIFYLLFILYSNGSIKGNKCYD
jgi:hypothetical protein